MFNSYSFSIGRKHLAKTLYRESISFKVQNNYFTPPDFGTQALYEVSIDFRLSNKALRDRRQISLPISSEFKRTYQLFLPLKSPENHKFSDDFTRNRSYLIRSNSLDVRSEINIERVWEIKRSLKLQHLEGNKRRIKKTKYRQLMTGTISYS